MNPELLLKQLEPNLPEWLYEQRWFARDDEVPNAVYITETQWLREENPALLWTLVKTDKGAVYQVPIGFRVAGEEGGVLLGHEHALIARVNDEGRDYLAYDALVDPALDISLYDFISETEGTLKSARPIGLEQSNSSLVFDNRVILKVFRRLHEGPNPDLEVPRQLTEAGFPHVAPVVLTWERGDLDLAVGQPYLYDGTEGWQLALASVRDYFGADTQGATSTAGSPSLRIDNRDPASAGGDFASEAFRLGEVTAGLHLAMADNFPHGEFDPNVLAESLAASADSVPAELRPALTRLIDGLCALDSASAGWSIRLHGDYHLGQTLRSVSGWYIFDFEGEPARPMDQRIIPSSPYKDVAGMLRSFQYAAATGLFEQMPAERESMQGMAAAWEQRNRDAFRSGYMSVDEIERILPADPIQGELLLAGFEVEKAIYEREYERAYRPEWLPIPEVALKRLLATN